MCLFLSHLHITRPDGHWLSLRRNAGMVPYSSTRKVLENYEIVLENEERVLRYEKECSSTKKGYSAWVGGWVGGWACAAVTCVGGRVCVAVASGCGRGAGMGAAVAGAAARWVLQLSGCCACGRWRPALTSLALLIDFTATGSPEERVLPRKTTPKAPLPICLSICSRGQGEMGGGVKLPPPSNATSPRAVHGCR